MKQDVSSQLIKISCIGCCQLLQLQSYLIYRLL